MKIVGIAKQINKKVLCYAEIGLLRVLTSVVICCNPWFFFVIVLNNVLKLSTKQVSDLLTTCFISAFIPSSLSYEKFPSVQTIFRLFSPILLINFLKTEDFPAPISNAVMRIFSYINSPLCFPYIFAFVFSDRTFSSAFLSNSQ